MVNSWIKNGKRVVDKFDDVLPTSESKLVNANVANKFDNYDGKKLHAHFWLSNTILIYLTGVVDDITALHSTTTQASIKLMLFHS